MFSRLRRALLTVPLVLCLGWTALAAQPAAAAPAPPSISEVVPGPGSGELTVTYTAPADASSIEVSLDQGQNWYTCVGERGSCPLANLAVGREYVIVLRAVNAAGEASAASQPATATPTRGSSADPDKPVPLPLPVLWVGASFTPVSNNIGVNGTSGPVGVGALPRLRFNQDITSKAAVERHLRVSATDASGTQTEVPGAWGWLDDRTAVFRPENFWPGDSTISITSTMNRAVLGKKGSTTLVGGPSLDHTWTFRTDRRLIARVDGEKHTMTVHINGKRVKVFKISLGRPGWSTTEGVKVISTDKLPTHTYTSEALGITDPNDQYVLTGVRWNTRVTPSGEFIHSAPWAYGRLGRWNGSHGCTNMFESDAKWIFDNTKPGDVVVYQNTGGQLVSRNNGPGGLWSIPWDQWLSMSALGSGTGVPAVTS